MIEFRLKEKTKSLNESFRGDWKTRAGIAKSQRAKAMKACPPWPKSEPLLVVRLTRVSPGTLDDDALPAALKHVRDGVAGRLRIDDASPLVRWDYAQAKGSAEVVVQVFKAGEPCTVSVDEWVNRRVPPTAPMPSYVPPHIKPMDAERSMGMGDAIHDQDPEWLKARVQKSMDAAKMAAETFAPPSEE